jgi:hypothetical protein
VSARLVRAAVATAALVASAAAAASACGFIVDVGDHSLRPGEDGGSGTDATFPGDAPRDATPSSPDATAGDGAADATADATADVDAALPPLGDAADTGAIPLAQGQHHPTDIAADEVNVYWINEGDPDASIPGAILSMPVEGGPPTTLVAAVVNPRMMRLALNYPNYLYFTADDWNDAGGPALYRIERAGGSGVPAVISETDDGFGYGALGVSAPNAYTAAADPDGGPPALRLSSGAGFPDSDCYPYVAPGAGTISSITVDDPHVFFVDTAAGAVVRGTLGCDASFQTFATAPTARLLTHGPTSVFWTTGDTVYSLLASKPLGATTDLLGERCTPLGLSFPFVDEAGISEELYATCTDGSIWRLPLAGLSTAPVEVATGQSNPTSVAALPDGTPVWTNYDTGEIMTLRQ